MARVWIPWNHVCLLIGWLIYLLIDWLIIWFIRDGHLSLFRSLFQCAYRGQTYKTCILWESNKIKTISEQEQLSYLYKVWCGHTLIWLPPNFKRLCDIWVHIMPCPPVNDAMWWHSVLDCWVVSIFPQRYEFESKLFINLFSTFKWAT